MALPKPSQPAFLDGEAGRLDVSLARSLEALSHLKDQFKQDTLIGTWYTIGWTHYYLGNYPAALEFGLKALKLAQDLQYREWEAWCLDLTASTFKEGTQALQMYTSAFAIFEELENIEGQSRILNNWACTLLDSKEFTAALEMAQRSLYLAKLRFEPG
jgi:tetratricopeptide (TPR) repeat protein